MKIACPKCQRGIELRDGTCSECGFKLSLQGIGTYYWGALRSWLVKTLVVACPECGGSVPLNSKSCTHCGTAITVGKAVNSVTDPVRQQYHAVFDKPTPSTLRRLRWLYVMGSAFLLAILLALLGGKDGKEWFMHAGVAALYISVAMLLVRLIAPLQLLLILLKRCYWQIKLGLVFNYLSFLLILQALIGAWWGHALTLAGLFVVAILSVWMLRLILQPTFLPAAGPQAPARGAPHNVSAHQGRTGRYD